MPEATPDLVPPNPFSPYATADPTLRHGWRLWQRPFEVGRLVGMACSGLEVVPEPDPELVAELDAALRAHGRTPPGFCRVCINVITGRIHVSPYLWPDAGPCRNCGNDGGTGELALCSWCRQPMHWAWWPTRS